MVLILPATLITFCVRGVTSPLISNLYLNEVDKMLERAKVVTRRERWTAVEYARFADDLVILVDSKPRQQWPLRWTPIVGQNLVRSKEDRRG
jgi:hypothetical protein